MRLREGPRAPLITPQACGTYQTTAKLYPFSDPGTATVTGAPFKIASGANGGACASSEAGLPNSPTLSAGSTLTNAGSYSPFVFKLSREDGSQRFGAIVAEPPLGLTAKLAGVPYCPEAGIAQAAARSAEGDGAMELAAPSCPAAREIGTVIAAAGAGPTPYYTTGKVYLAGPYKGAPLSFEAIVPRRSPVPSTSASSAPASPPTSTKKRPRSPPLRPAAVDPPRHPARRPLGLGADGPPRIHPQPDQLRTDRGHRLADLPDRLGGPARPALPGRRLPRPGL